MNKRIAISILCFGLTLLGILNMNVTQQSSDTLLMDLNSVAVANAEQDTFTCLVWSGMYCKTPQRIWYNAYNPPK